LNVQLLVLIPLFTGPLKLSDQVSFQGGVVLLLPDEHPATASAMATAAMTAFSKITGVPVIRSVASAGVPRRSSARHADT
jgi:hypothetical protein